MITSILRSLLQLYFPQSQLPDLELMLPIASTLWPGDYQRLITGLYVHRPFKSYPFLYGRKSFKCIQSRTANVSVIKLLRIIICLPLFFIVKVDEMSRTHVLTNICRNLFFITFFICLLIKFCNSHVTRR